MAENSTLDGKLSLHSAAASNDLIQMVELFNREANPNSRNEVFKTPLHEAALNNAKESHYKAIDLLLHHGADVNAQDSEGRTPLHYLVENGSDEIVKLLLRFKANVNIVCNQNQSLLFPAACNYQNPEVTQLLVEHGLNVNHRDANASSPLHVAASNYVDRSHFTICDVLIKSGANVNSRDKIAGRTALHYLFERCDIRILNWKLEDLKADLRVVDYQGCSLLMLAAGNDDYLVRYLLSRGLNIKQRSRTGRTALHWAAKLPIRKLLFMMKILVKNGAEVDVPDYEGLTPLVEVVRSFESRMSYGYNQHALRFFMERSDLGLMRNDISRDLALQSEYSREFLWATVAEHVAKLVELEIPVSRGILDGAVLNQVRLKYDYFERCRKELSRARRTKICQKSWVTCYDLLMGSRRLKNYAGHRDFVADCQSYDFNKNFLIYGGAMKKKFENGVKRREMYDKSAGLLSGCLPIFDPYHLIIRDILDNLLNFEDLSKLCK